MTLSDAAVVALACDGDSEAFRALVERHGRAVFRLAHRMTGNQADAEDIVQETFIRAYRQLNRFESRASFGTWIHRIAANCAIDLLRSRGGHQEATYDDALLKEPTLERGTPRDPSPERLTLSREVRDAVQNAMGRLSPLERAAFVLRHFEGARTTRSARRWAWRPAPRSTACFGRCARCVSRSPHSSNHDATSHRG